MASTVFDQIANLGYTTVTVGATKTGLSITVASGGVLPTVPFNAVVWPTGVAPGPGNAEIVRVTANASGALTITRVAETGGISRVIAAGDQFMAASTKKTFTDIQTAINRLEVLRDESFLNPKEPQFGAKGDGVTDDGPAINACLAAGKEKAVRLLPGAYATKEPLLVPSISDFRGVDWRSCRIIGKGNFDVLRLTEGDNVIENMLLETESPQTSGCSAIDFSHGFSINARIANVNISSNFYNGLYIVGGSIDIGNIDLESIYFATAFGSGVKKYGNAAIVMGSSTRRTYVVNMQNVSGVAELAADMPCWLKVVNTDSLFCALGGFQTGINGISIGEGDTSALGTTNVSIEGWWFDACTGIGWKLENLFASDFVNSHAQGSSTGCYISQNVAGMTWMGGKLYHNKGNGLTFGPSASKSVTFNGATIVDNNENGVPASGAETTNGVLIEKGASGILLVNNTIGNLGGGLGGDLQQYGVRILKGKSRNIWIVQNRIVGNKAAPIKVDGVEGTEAEKATVKANEAENMLV
jgi:hypothetical protein